MIVTYLLDVSRLPDPMENQEVLDGLPKERIEKICRLKHSAARKQSLGAGLLLAHGLHQAAVFSGDKKQEFCGRTSRDSGMTFREKLSVHSSRMTDRDTVPVVKCGAYGKPYLAAGAYDSPYLEECRCSTHGSPYLEECGCSTHGSPYLTQSGGSARTQEPVHALPFNLSHTGSYAIASIWFDRDKDLPQNAAVGCDIEQVKKYDPRIARRFFTRSEYQILEETDRQRQAEMFCRYWTRKESVIKMTGLGMSLPLDLFEVIDGTVTVPDEEKLAAWQASAAGEEQAEAYSMAGKLLLSKAVHMKEYRYEDCRICVCGMYGQFVPEVVAVDAAEGL